MNVSPRQNPAYRLSRRAIAGTQHALGRARCVVGNAGRSCWRARWPVLFVLYAALISGLSHIPLPTSGDAAVFPGADKLVHIVEFALLALLAWKAFRRRLLPALLACIAFAAADELHQALVPARVASPFDAAADVLGAMLGLLLARWGPRLWAFLRRRILEAIEFIRGIT